MVIYFGGVALLALLVTGGEIVMKCSRGTRRIERYAPAVTFCSFVGLMLWAYAGLGWFAPAAPAITSR